MIRPRHAPDASIRIVPEGSESARRRRTPRLGRCRGDGQVAQELSVVRLVVAVCSREPGREHPGSAAKHASTVSPESSARPKAEALLPSRTPFAQLPANTSASSTTSGTRCSGPRGWIESRPTRGFGSHGGAIRRASSRPLLGVAGRQDQSRREVNSSVRRGPGGREARGVDGRRGRVERPDLLVHESGHFNVLIGRFGSSRSVSVFAGAMMTPAFLRSARGTAILSKVSRSWAAFGCWGC